MKRTGFHDSGFFFQMLHPHLSGVPTICDLPGTLRKSGGWFAHAEKVCTCKIGMLLHLAPVMYWKDLYVITGLLVCVGVTSEKDYFL